MLASTWVACRIFYMHISFWAFKWVEHELPNAIRAWVHSTFVFSPPTAVAAAEGVACSGRGLCKRLAVICNSANVIFMTVWDRECVRQRERVCMGESMQCLSDLTFVLSVCQVALVVAVVFISHMRVNLYSQPLFILVMPVCVCVCVWAVHTKTFMTHWAADRSIYIGQKLLAMWQVQMSWLKQHRHTQREREWASECAGETEKERDQKSNKLIEGSLPHQKLLTKMHC